MDLNTLAPIRQLTPVKATVIDDNAFSLLAFPFGGPIPSPKSAKGVDLDGEWFSERTDIKADWLDFRWVDWHHGNDRLMGRAAFAKANNLRMDSIDGFEGWWVDVWVEHGNRRVELIKALAERGAQLYGSSESMPSMVAKASTGEILVWPYIRQTLSTSPQNTYSVIRPLKAVLEDVTPSPSMWAEMENAIRGIGADLRGTSEVGNLVAKAGRVLSQRNEKDIRDAIEQLDAAIARVREVVARQPDYHKDTAGDTADH